MYIINDVFIYTTNQNVAVTLIPTLDKCGRGTMGISFYIITALTFSAVIKVNSLQCYVCQDCSTVKDDYLATCGSAGSTTITPTVTSTTSGETTTVASTTAPSSTTAGSTAATSTTVSVAPSSTTAETGSATSTTVSAAPSSTTAETGSATSTTVSALSSRDKGSLSISPSADTTFASARSVPHAIRVRRAAVTKSGCNCETDENCDCTPDLFYSEIVNYAETTTDYLCYKMTAKVNNTDTVVRGCTIPLFPNNKTLCELFQDQVESCSTCNTDKCNGAFTLHLSLFVLLSAFPMSYLI